MWNELDVESNNDSCGIGGLVPWADGFCGRFGYIVMGHGLRWGGTEAFDKQQRGRISSTVFNATTAGCAPMCNKSRPQG